ncbi:hypothetical protein NEA10_02500 [Phormidium yuhuli AB48]|uniref:AbrB/MazE/SpoVT family DNA-binding domain-containing protein n=1 Tax=Phormidium yuhuli AB48 TaxID=2940671 RepID=A0ABY5AQW7_9CYAN|nr:hypothetical protein [Phormidium yuhuli]USR91617.1 hypothetical protein NEA10_02500 [Phormidium yuhuli AB48]
MRCLLLKKTIVEIEVEGDHLTIRTVRRLRNSWDKAFAEMAKEQDDVLLDKVNSTDWEQREWEW